MDVHSQQNKTQDYQSQRVSLYHSNKHNKAMMHNSRRSHESLTRSLLIEHWKRKQRDKELSLCNDHQIPQDTTMMTSELHPIQISTIVHNTKNNKINSNCKQAEEHEEEKKFEETARKSCRRRFENNIQPNERQDAKTELGIDIKFNVAKSPIPLSRSRADRGGQKRSGFSSSWPTSRAALPNYNDNRNPTRISNNKWSSPVMRRPSSVKTLQISPHQQQMIMICVILTNLIMSQCFFNVVQQVNAFSGGGGSTNGNQQASSQQQATGDPRPTIYSGQISIGLLLSAHSSSTMELASSASQQVRTFFALQETNENRTSNESNTDYKPPPGLSIGASETSKQVDGSLIMERPYINDEVSYMEGEHMNTSYRRRKRQLFDSSTRQSNNQRSTAQEANNNGANSQLCSQVNLNALYAGMGAIWASHQANLVAGSQSLIGTYVYDSCNDLNVGQRQSVRIVSNLNAFQQTTCESPRGSPISLTIAHGDNQLRAIQLLTSFKVPVISTKEHFALEEYQQLSRDQRKYLFATAPSSRHLALGALKFAKRIVAKSSGSPKLLNQFHKLSSRNGLVIVSRNLPTRFMGFLSETVPNLVNYEFLQTSQPIEQVSSIQGLESLLMKRNSAAGSSGASSASGGPAASESRPNPEISPMPSLERRSDMGGGGDELSMGGDSGSDSLEEINMKMISPTILMFITTAEAIDLITRLRNDLADVSKYYSLIVVTREDITPALRTIFSRGGSRLCSGKAFYTISPKPDDMVEFSRYFRDTVQIEGESSEHPLICEFAKQRSSSRLAHDIDDVSAEPVIKAVWTAAAAFMQVHRRECGAYLNNGAQSSSSATSTSANLYAKNPASNNNPKEEATNNQDSAARNLKGRQSNSQTGQASAASGKSAHSECMFKMSKSMTQLVQRTLKRLDVTINSTGLQSLDGFRVKFDDMNELISNKFSIRHINKECEIEEIGQYTGLKESSLRLDDSALAKSLESTLPDAWPLGSSSSTPSSGGTSTGASSSTDSTANSSAGNSNFNDATSPSGVDSASSSGSGAAKETASSSDPSNSSEGGSDGGQNAMAGGSLGEQPASTTHKQSRKRRPAIIREDLSHDPNEGSWREPEPENNEGENNPDNNNQDQSLATSIHDRIARHRPNKRSRSDSLEAHSLANVVVPVRKLSADESTTRKPKGRLSPVMTTTHVGGARKFGLSDQPTTTTESSTELHANDQQMTGGSNQQAASTTRPGRKLKPFPTTAGTKLKDWLPNEHPMTTTTTITSRQPNEMTTIGPIGSSSSPIAGGKSKVVVMMANHGQSNHVVGKNHNKIAHHPSLTNTRAPSTSYVGSTLPESGGNTDLEIPAARSTPRSGKIAASESRDVITETTPLINISDSRSTSSPASSSITNDESSSATTVASVTLKPFGRHGFSFDMGHQHQQHQHQPSENQQQFNDISSSAIPPLLRELDFTPVALSSDGPNIMNHPTKSTLINNNNNVNIEEQTTPTQPASSESIKMNRSKIR